jgi:hypothetical protein
MSQTHHVVTHSPFWGPVFALTAIIVVMVPGLVFGAEALIESGAVSQDAGFALILGGVIGGTLALIGGFVGLSVHAGRGHGPQIPGTRTAEVRIVASGVAVPSPISWAQIVEVVHIPGAVTASAAAAIPHDVAGVPIRRSVGAVVLVLRTGEEVVLSPLSADAGLALADDLQAGLARARASA